MAYISNAPKISFRFPALPAKPTLTDPALQKYVDSVDITLSNLQKEMDAFVTRLNKLLNNPTLIP